MVEEVATIAAEKRYLPMPDPGEVTLAGILDALADPVRLAIVQELSLVSESPCGALTVRVSESTRSHHLRTLREAGVTRTRISGTQRLVALRRDDLDARFPGLLDAVLVAAATAPRAG